MVVAFITSQIPDDLEPYDLMFDPSQPEAQEMGLKLPSVLRLHRLFTTDASLLHRKLGQLPSTLQTEVETRLRGLFGL